MKSLSDLAVGPGPINFKKQTTLSYSRSVSSLSSEDRPLRKVISGGQTGADRAGLESAKRVGIETGGTCPSKYMTSNGPNPDLGFKFGLSCMETSTSASSSLRYQYPARSRINVDAADGTVVFRLKPSDGSDLTIGYCHSGRWKKLSDSLVGTATEYKPYLVISALSPDVISSNVERLIEFAVQYKIGTLNVAGHRDDRSSGLRDFGSAVESVLDRAFLALKINK